MPTITATIRRATNTAIGKGEAGSLKSFGVRTIEVPNSADGTEIDFQLLIPSNVRLSLASRVYFDDLASSGSPTLDLGLFPVDANISADDDALNDGLALSTASASDGVPVIKDFANGGKQAWEFVSGQTVDPQGLLSVRGVIRDAATNLAGTISIELFGYMD